MRVRPSLVFTVAVTVAAGCRGGGDPLPVPATLEAVATSNNQSAPAGAPLPAPLEVVVRTAGGLGALGGQVRWEITAGTGAVLSDTVTTADGTGRAQVILRLGPTAGEYRVRAALPDVPDQVATFTATASPPPQLSTVTPGTFGGGDTVVLGGTALAAGALVEIGGRVARVLSGSATQLTVLAPHCLVAGPVQVRATLAGARSNALTATFQAAAGPVALAVGDFVSIDPAQAAGCTTFPAAGGAGAEYLVIPQSVTSTPGLTAPYALLADSVAGPGPATVPPAGTLPAAVRFHDHLRELERAATAAPRAGAGGGDPGMAAAIQLSRVKTGDRREFRVCSVITCQQEADFARVTAEAMWVGQRAALFVDRNAPAPFSAAQLDTLGRLFDDDLFEVGTRAFGAESDIDRNGVVAVLFTPVVNGLTPRTQCQTSVITGFFFGIDIDPFFQEDPRSNKGEVFYALAPDPNGTVTCDLTADEVRRFVQVTFVHEFQHMISYHQHVLLRNGPVEVLWLNEALSHVAEELAGFRFDARGDNLQFSRFVIGNLFNGYQFLENPGAFFALPAAGTGSLAERGAAWLFVRFLLDRAGPDRTRELVETRRTGGANVEAVLGEPMERLLAEWLAAVWVSDLTGFTAPSRLRYTTWALRTTYASLNTQLPSRFPRPFPVVPTVFTDGVGSRSGTLRSGSGEFVRVVQNGNAPAFTLSFVGPGGAAISATVVPRLTVLRIR